MPLGAASAREKLRAFVTGYFDFLATHPNYPRLVQREAMESSRNFGWIVQRYLRPFHNQLVRTIQDGIAAGEFRQVDADHMALSILGMTTSYFAAAPILSEIVGRDLLAAEIDRSPQKGALRFSGSWLELQRSGRVPMTGKKFIVMISVLFAIALVVYIVTTPKGSDIPLTGLVDGNTVIVSPQIPEGSSP